LASAVTMHVLDQILSELRRSNGGLIQTGPEPLPPSPGPPSTDPIDMEALLTERASAQGEGDAWRTSLDAFLVLLDLPAGPATMTSLASELNLPAPGANDRAAEARLYKALMRELAVNGAQVPAQFMI
jgi:hypothetical protein